MSDANTASCVVIRNEDYINPEQLRHFRNRLVQWRDDLCRNLEGWPGEIVEQGLPDWVDSAAQSSRVELSWVERERNLAIVRQIDAALQRIAAGTFGYCVESGEEIGLRRLMALPIAQYSVEIQSEIERHRQTHR